MKVLVLDNYDSFTFNLVQYIQEILDQKVDVFRNDAISLDAVDNYQAIILSPGPGLPADAGIMPELIKRYGPTKAILGVCLGHQAIGEAFGGSLENLTKVYHGIETPIEVTDPAEPMFQGLPTTLQVGRYHSWVVRKEDLPDCFNVTSVAEEGVVMSMTHKQYNVRGVQFHPESIMTEHGHAMLQNFFTHCVSEVTI